MKFRICPVCGGCVPEGQYSAVEYSHEVNQVIKLLQKAYPSRPVEFTVQGKQRIENMGGLDGVFDSYQGCQCLTCRSRTSDDDLVTIDTEVPFNQWNLPLHFSEYILPVPPSDGFETSVNFCIKTAASSYAGTVFAIIIGIVFVCLGSLHFFFYFLALLFLGVGVWSIVASLRIGSGNYTLSCNNYEKHFGLRKGNSLRIERKDEWQVVLVNETLTSVGLVNKVTNEKIRLTGCSELAYGDNGSFDGIGNLSNFLFVYHVVCGLLNQDPGCTPVLMWRFNMVGNALKLEEKIGRFVAGKQSEVQNAMKDSFEAYDAAREILTKTFGSVVEYEKHGTSEAENFLGEIILNNDKAQNKPNSDEFHGNMSQSHYNEYDKRDYSSMF